MKEKKKILIVDDNEDIVITYRVVLDRMGYEVAQAYDGLQCLEYMEKQKPDLVLLDVRLPGLSGAKVCRSIKETSQTSDVPVVAITASMSADTREKMSEVGADEFLLKPIDANDLNRVVKKYLG